MSNHLKTNCRKVLFSLLAAACLAGGVTPNCLNASTISQSVKTGKSIKIKDTVLTFGEISKDAKGLYVDITLDRANGMPQGIQGMSIENEQGKVQINDKTYGVYVSVRNNTIKRVSNAQLQVKANVILNLDKGGSAKNITPEMLKGKSLTIPIKEILYYGKASSIGGEFKNLLKNVSKVQGVSLKKAGFEFLQGDAECKLKNVLPEKGLNVPICDGSKSVIDNIGFVDGALQIRMKDPANEFIEIHAIDSAGKQVKDIGAGENSDFIYQYQIKDAVALGQCQFKVTGNKIIASDKEEKTLEYLA